MRQLKYPAFVLTVLLLPGLACADWLRDEAAIMGTAVNVELWHDDEQQGRLLIDAAMDEMRRIDQLMSSYKAESELSRVNAEAATQAVIVSNELFSLIEQALRYSDITEGAFDITYASAGQYYDYRTGRKPDDQQLAAALPAISYRHVLLNKT
ncbi:MAG TPA: FAD:protein FMN transferase, partial [Gammaproteobacteria bacterium]|nr:FAD:protein FMN transferase [Gammaproteobacteria bacterium]